MTEDPANDQSSEIQVNSIGPISTIEEQSSGSTGEESRATGTVLAEMTPSKRRQNLERPRKHEEDPKTVEPTLKFSGQHVVADFFR